MIRNADNLKQDQMTMTNNCFPCFPSSANSIYFTIHAIVRMQVNVYERPYIWTTEKGWRHQWSPQLYTTLAAVKKRSERDSNPWPLRYRRSAGAGHKIVSSELRNYLKFRKLTRRTYTTSLLTKNKSTVEYGNNIYFTATLGITTIRLSSNARWKNGVSTSNTA